MLTIFKPQIETRRNLREFAFLNAPTVLAILYVFDWTFKLAKSFPLARDANKSYRPCKQWLYEWTWVCNCPIKHFTVIHRFTRDLFAHYWFVLGKFVQEECNLQKIYFRVTVRHWNIIQLQYSIYNIYIITRIVCFWKHCPKTIQIKT